jgi:uncharacterized protein (TIGR02145 family)
MKNIRFLSFRLLLTLGLATVVFNSCGDDDYNLNDRNKLDNSNKPSNSTGIGPATSTTDPGVLINGILWATRNVGAYGTFTVNPEDAGMFYQWNSYIGWNFTDPMNPNGVTTWISSWDGNPCPCPAGWRIPTSRELRKLRDVSNSWTTTESGVSGRLFRSESGNDSIFLPAAGYLNGEDGTLHEAGGYGYYWSSTRDGNASFLYFCSDSVSPEGLFRPAFGLSCRCVKD